MHSLRNEKIIESDVVRMYSAHPSPSTKDKLAYASRRMKLRLYSCGVTESDYVGKHILDAGCGSGEYSCWFASQGATVTGIDLSKPALAEAQKYAEETGLDGVSFKVRSVLDTGFDDACFDLVYCTGVLHHTPDPFGGMVELCRVLRPEGKILVSFYNTIGFFPRVLRRRIAQFFAGNDLDQRVAWGRRLFPPTARRLMKGQRNDPQFALYDYFAIPFETTHSIREVCRWFDQLGLQYIGTFPPAHLGDYPAVFAHESYGSIEKRFQSRLSPILARIGARREMKRIPPNVLSQLIVQIIWLAQSAVIFSIGGQKQKARVNNK